jgi:hypothetical protein
MLDALRLDFSEPHPSVDEAVLRIEGEPLNAQRRLIGRPQAAPEGGLPWLAVGAEGTGGDHGLDPAGAVHFFDLHKP